MLPSLLGVDWAACRRPAVAVRRLVAGLSLVEVSQGKANLEKETRKEVSYHVFDIRLFQNNFFPFQLFKSKSSFLP